MQSNHVHYRLQWKALALLLCIGAAGAGSAFELKDTSGAPQQLAQLKGKWVVVNFWATWCAPCLKEIPDLAQFAKTQKGNVQVIGVVQDWNESGKTDVDQRKVAAFARKVGHNYPLVLSDAVSEKAFGRMKGLPTTLVYDPEGRLITQKTGPVDAQWLQTAVSTKPAKP